MFSNLIIYHTACNAIDIIEPLRKAIPDNVFTPVVPLQLRAVGFEALVSGGPAFHEQQNALLFQVKVQERKIAPAALREAVAAEITEIETEQARKVYRKERLSIKADLIEALTPAQLPTSRSAQVIIDAKHNLVFINSASIARGEQAINFVREKIGSFPLLIPEVRNSPAAVMTKWVDKKPPRKFLLGDWCKLKEPGEFGAAATLDKSDLTSEAVQGLLAEGKTVEAVALAWDQKVVFRCHEPWHLKRLRLSLELLEGLDDVQDEPVARCDADFTLMVDTFRDLFPAVGRAFGGWLEAGQMNLRGE